MFLTPHEIAQGRDYTLNNLLGISTACLGASQRLSELLANGGRDALSSGSRHLAQFGHGQLEALTHLPSTLWLEHSTRTSKLLGSAYEIVGETHKMLIHSAEAQIRVLDQIAFSSLDRLSRNSPWEATIALSTMRSTLESAEQTLHGASSAAIETLELAELEVREFSQAQEEAPKQKPKTTSRSRTRAN